MHKIKNRIALSSFLEKLEQLSYSYPTLLSGGNYRKPQMKLHNCRFRISIKDPALWNDLVGSTEKEIQSSSLLKTKAKTKLLNFDLEVTFFNTICLWKLIHKNINRWQRCITVIVRSCLHFIIINQGLTPNPIGFLRVSPLKF